MEYEFDDNDDQATLVVQPEAAFFPDIPAEAPGILTEHKEVHGASPIQDEPTQSNKEQAALAAENSGMEFGPINACETREVIELLDDEGHMWPSGWVVRKVANGPGFEPSAKGGVSSEGPKLVFHICAYVGAMTVWGRSYAASISFHSHIDYNKVLKIRGARGPVCLSHAVPVSGSELCPTG